MAPYLNSDSPEDVKQILENLEKQSDRWNEHLFLLRRPWNVASWGALTATIGVIEEVIRLAGFASQQRATRITLGQVAPMLLNHTKKDGVTAPVSKFRWSRQLAIETADALDAAHRYLVFPYVFSLWHRDQCFAELIGPQRVRFTALGGANERRVSAYHKGFRPTGYKSIFHDVPIEPSVEESEQLREAQQKCDKHGFLGFKYPPSYDCWELLFDSYHKRLVSMFRRSLNLNLGIYTLGEFVRFYAALLAISATHEHLCFRWGQTHKFPLDSAVLVKPRSAWIRHCSTLSSIVPEVTDSILTDLSLGTTRPLDLHIHPFVPLNASSTILGLVPHFPLLSRPDENILRVCSHVKREIFDTASLLKETELRENLISSIPERFIGKGPVNLPLPLPDLDFIVVDYKSATIIICELKWIRSPFLPLERIDRDQDCSKGIQQLSKIKAFLECNADYLKNRGVLNQSILAFPNRYYILVARDHFFWIDPSDGVALVDFEQFQGMLIKATDLNSGIQELLRYNWLPVEGKDFEVRYEYAVSNGVIVDSEIFYPVKTSAIALKDVTP